MDNARAQGMTTTATVPGNYEFRNGRSEREERLVIRQYREMSRKHGEHGRPFTIMIHHDVDGTVSVFSGTPAGRVKK